MLYIFDKDGTICRSISGQKFINSVDDQELYPDVKLRLLKLKHDDRIAVASNQGGVAFGFMSIIEAAEIVRHSSQLIGGARYILCPHHPNGTNEFRIDCEYRKPKPCMLFQMMEQLNYNRADTIFIGDMDTDEQAALHAGIDFVWAKDFFNRQ